MIDRDTLTSELAAIDQQIAQNKDTLARCEQVRVEAMAKLNACEGARNFAQHLLAKLDQEQPQDKFVPPDGTATND